MQAAYLDWENGKYHLFHQGLFCLFDVSDTGDGHDDRIIVFESLYFMILVISASIFSNGLSIYWPV